MKVKGKVQGYSDSRIDGFLENSDGHRLYAGSESAYGYVEGNDRRSKMKMIWQQWLFSGVGVRP